MAKWNNLDGLLVRFGTTRADEALDGTTSPVAQRTFIQDLIWDKLPAATDANDDRPSIPANAYITDAYLIVEEAFTSGGTTTLTLGLIRADGVTAIDADGIDATIAKTAIDAQYDVVKCDGALVGGVLTTGANPGWVYATVGDGPYTAGKAKLVINYIVV